MIVSATGCQAAGAVWEFVNRAPIFPMVALLAVTFIH